MNRQDGRFDPDSDTPLLTPEEDANDFRLFAEVLPDNREAEERKRREAEEKAKKNTPDLFGRKPKERWRTFYNFGKRLCDYKYKHTDGAEFEIVRHTLKECRAMRDIWLEEKNDSKNLLKDPATPFSDRKMNRCIVDISPIEH